VLGEADSVLAGLFYLFSGVMYLEDTQVFQKYLGS